MLAKSRRLLLMISLRRYSLVRIAAGLFGVYFFASYYAVIDYVLAFRSKTETNFFNHWLNFIQPEVADAILRFSLAGLVAAGLSLSAGRFVRLSALLVGLGFLFFYNFFWCIYQPHLTYVLYIMLTFVFLDRGSFFTSRSPGTRFRNPKILIVPTTVYMLQMSIAGFSKALSPEWRDGSMLRVLADTVGPQYGPFYPALLPEFALTALTWFVLFFECFSFLFFFHWRLRLPIWLIHTSFYIVVILFIPTATHVGFAMLMFNFLILDRHFIKRPDNFAVWK